jgi:hypothetical protein
MWYRACRQLVSAFHDAPVTLSKANLAMRNKLRISVATSLYFNIRGCIQKFPDLPPGARTANGTTLCYYVQLYRHFVSQSSEFCRHNTICFFSTGVYCYCCCCCCCLFRYRLSPETFGRTLVSCGHFFQNRDIQNYTSHSSYITLQSRGNSVSRE